MKLQIFCKAWGESGKNESFPIHFTVKLTFVVACTGGVTAELVALTEIWYVPGGVPLLPPALECPPNGHEPVLEIEKLFKGVTPCYAQHDRAQRHDHSGNHVAKQKLWHPLLRLAAWIYQLPKQ